MLLMHNIRLATVLEVVAWDQPSSELCTSQNP